MRTFWAKFGWGNVPLVGSKPYRILAVVTVLGIVGANWAVWRDRHVLQWEVFLLLFLAMFGIWITTIQRGIGSIFGWYLIPVARYAYPAILPTVLVLNTGWLELIHAFGRWLRMTTKVAYAAYLLCFVALDAVSIFSIIRYYQ